MSKKIVAIHERVDDIPVIIAQLQRMRVARLIDKHFPTNGNRTGLSLGQMCVVWLTFILSEADHRLNQVETWVAEHQVTLSRSLNCQVERRDCTDDRLATGLDYLSVTENWESFETKLNGLQIRVYDLTTDRVRIDTTTASAFVTPDGMFQLGHSKDHRPDLPQLKLSLSTLDPLGLALTTTIVAGNAADDPLYLPEIAKVRQSLRRKGVTYIGDCKLAALETRADIVAHDDYYLCPLTARQVPTAELDRLLRPVWAGRRKPIDIYAPPEEEEKAPPTPDERIAVGFELTVPLSGKDQTGKTQYWNERRLVVRSLRLAESQEKSLRERVARAQAEIARLNERKQRKPRLLSLEQAQAAATRIAERHRVREFLRIEVRREEQERTLRRYGARPAMTLIEERIVVQAKVDNQSLNQAVRRLGWRVYATNQDAASLPLKKAVWAYREQYLIEQCFGRVKGRPLSLTPFYLQYEHRIVGLVLLLTIALRVLVLSQFVARRNLKEQDQRLSGIYVGQPGRQTDRPTTEMMIRAFRGITLSRFSVDGEPHWHISPLSVTQKRILKLLGISPKVFSRLIPTF
jgi:transposase